MSKTDWSKVTDGVGLPIDPDILPLIIDLNDAGYTTRQSCSGWASKNHPKWKSGSRKTNHGWIDFKDLKEGMLTEEIIDEIDSIVKEHTNVPYTLKSSKKYAKLSSIPKAKKSDFTKSQWAWMMKEGPRLDYQEGKEVSKEVRSGWPVRLRFKGSL